MKSIFALLLATAIASTVLAQDCRFRLSGHAEDADTKEKLAGATVLIRELDKRAITDENGDFIFYNLCKGEYTLLISHVNCEPIEQKILVDKDTHRDIFLSHARQSLGEVVVEAKKGIPNTGIKKELSGRLLEQTKGFSLSEALSRINGVTMLQTGANISKPVIHGLHSNRILTINNGVRQEGQQWGNEHAPEIDPFIADKLTVIKGVDELRYGSDAIGGVILVQPKPLNNHPGYNAAINTAYFTNNRQYVVSGVFEQQLRKLHAFTYRIQGTYKRGANVTTPDYRLNNTASEEKNFSLTAGLRKKNWNTELFYSLFDTKVGIFKGSHISNITDLEKAIAAPRPDEVFTGQNTYEIGRPNQDVVHHLLKVKTQYTRNEHKFNLLLAGQFNNRKEYDIVRSSSNTKPQLNLSISTFSEELNWEQPTRNHFSGVAGISAMQQDNAYAGRYIIPNYTAYTFGAYYIEKWSKQQWDLSAGIRYDNKTINTYRMLRTADSSFANHDFNFSTLASSFNAGYKPGGGWKTNINIALASRAPHVNELLSNGIHHGTATYEQGDINLQPEKSINISGNLGWQNTANTVSFEVTLYHNSINDFIYQQPKPDEPVLSIAGAFPRIQYQQTNAVLYGSDVTVSINPLTQLSWVSRLSLLRAKNKQTNDWLILMPADRTSTELSYSFKPGKKTSDTYLSAEWQQVFKQTRVPDEKDGRQDYKAPPAAYSLINLNASSTILIAKLPVTFGVTVRNLFNTRYRDYLNSLRYFTDEMGRNIGLRMKIPIEKLYPH